MFVAGGLRARRAVSLVEDEPSELATAGAPSADAPHGTPVVFERRVTIVPPPGPTPGGGDYLPPVVFPRRRKER